MNETTPRLLPTKVWTLIHNAIMQMPTTVFVARLAHCWMYPETTQPVWRIDRDERELTISWAGSDLLFAGTSVLDWLLDDTDTTVPQGEWFGAVPDTPEGLE